MSKSKEDSLKLVAISFTILAIINNSIINSIRPKNLP